MKLSKNCVWRISCKDNGGVLKTKYDTDKRKLAIQTKKCLVLVELLNGLATTAALTAVENKIPDVNNLVKEKKIDYDAEILYIKSKYFSTADYNKFTSEKPDLKI